MQFCIELYIQCSSNTMYHTSLIFFFKFPISREQEKNQKTSERTPSRRDCRPVYIIRFIYKIRCICRRSTSSIINLESSFSNICELFDRQILNSFKSKENLITSFMWNDFLLIIFYFLFFTPIFIINAIYAYPMT